MKLSSLVKGKNVDEFDFWGTCRGKKIRKDSNNIGAILYHASFVSNRIENASMTWLVVFRVECIEQFSMISNEIKRLKKICFDSTFHVV